MTIIDEKIIIEDGIKYKIVSYDNGAVVKQIYDDTSVPDPEPVPEPIPPITNEELLENQLIIMGALADIVEMQMEG